MHGEFWGAEPSLQGFKSVHTLNLRVSDLWVSPKDVNFARWERWLGFPGFSKNGVLIPPIVKN